MAQLRQDPRLRHIARLPDSVMRERARDLVEHLGHWLTAGSEHALAPAFERAGRERWDDEVPLDEVVLAYLIVKEQIVDFVHDQGIEQTTVEVYAEEELEHSVGRFFDSVVYHVIRGYQAAARQEPHQRAARVGR